MFKRVVITITTFAAAIGSASISASADDYRGHSYGHRSQWQTKPSVVGGDGLPSYVSRVGTYSGGISAVRFKRNGIYFSANGGGGYLPRKDSASAGEPRIIHVNDKSLKANCSYEGGVCVIRP